MLNALQIFYECLNEFIENWSFFTTFLEKPWFYIGFQLFLSVQATSQPVSQPASQQPASSQPASQRPSQPTSQLVGGWRQEAHVPCLGPTNSLTKGDIDCLTGWLTDWLLDRLIDRLKDWLNNQWIDQLIDWLIACLLGCLVGWLPWLAGRLIDWLNAWLITIGWSTTFRIVKLTD